MNQIVYTIYECLTKYFLKYLVLTMLLNIWKIVFNAHCHSWCYIVASFKILNIYLILCFVVFSYNQINIWRYNFVGKWVLIERSATSSIGNELIWIWKIHELNVLVFYCSTTFNGILKYIYLNLFLLINITKNWSV